MRDKFLIVDGSSLVHRAFYAWPLLTNKKGVFTNALLRSCHHDEQNFGNGKAAKSGNLL